MLVNHGITKKLTRIVVHVHVWPSNRKFQQSSKGKEVAFDTKIDVKPEILFITGTSTLDHKNSVSSI